MVHRRLLGRRIHRELLRQLVTIAAMVAAERPGLAKQFRLPHGNATREASLASSRQMPEVTETRRELLARPGVASRPLEDLAEAVASYEASVMVTDNGR